ncbi:MAG: OsmC family protein [Candidatus Dormibacteria bacterium]
MTEPTTTEYSVRARTLEHGISEAACKGATITFDSSSGQSDSLPGPAELLCAAFAACLLKNVERFSQILPLTYDVASVEVTAERSAVPARFVSVTYELQIRTDEPDDRVELLHRNLGNYGTVYNTLAASCDVEGRVVPNRGHEPRTRSRQP